jgi:hypothetical protein
MLDKLFRAHSEKNGLGEKNGGAAMNGTASTKENPGVRRELSERPTPDMLRRTDSMTAFHAQKEFQDRTVSIGNDEREYFVSGCLLLLDCAQAADVDVEVIVQAGLDQSVHTTKSKNLRRGSIQSRKRVAKKQPSPAAMPSFYQHQAGGNHAPPDRQQSMDNCKCTIC